MPFSFTNKSAGDLIRSQDWNIAMAAIVALYDKINGSTGHRHTGGPEDGPQIPSAGLQDLAVLTQKLADLAVTTQKLADLSVTNQKLANTSVDGSKIANSSVGSAHIIAGSVDNTKLAANAVANVQIQNGAVTNGKMAANSVANANIINGVVDISKMAPNSVSTLQIVNGSITQAKMAPGVAAEIGVAVSTLSNGQAAAIPSGFSIGECRFICALSTIGYSGSGSFTMKTSINTSTGVVSLTDSGTVGGVVQVMAIAKRGGW